MLHKKIKRRVIMTEKDLLIQDLRRENKNLREEISKLMEDLKLMEEKINLERCNICTYCHMVEEENK